MAGLAGLAGPEEEKKLTTKDTKEEKESTTKDTKEERKLPAKYTKPGRDKGSTTEGAEERNR